jgi:hypothetical protein
MYLPLHAANNFSDFLWLLIVIVTIQCKPKSSHNVHVLQVPGSILSPEPPYIIMNFSHYLKAMLG